MMVGSFLDTFGGWLGLGWIVLVAGWFWVGYCTVGSFEDSSPVGPHCIIGQLSLQGNGQYNHNTQVGLLAAQDFMNIKHFSAPLHILSDRAT